MLNSLRCEPTLQCTAAHVRDGRRILLVVDLILENDEGNGTNKDLVGKGE